MKMKSVLTGVASAIALSLVMSSAANAAAENAGEFYLGAKTGWANFSDTKFADNDDDAWAGSVYGGYQFNNWFSIEGGYNYLGTASDEWVKSQVQNGELSGKFDWNLGSAWNLFAKVGGSYNYVNQKNTPAGYDHHDEENWSLMLGTGVEYQLSHNWRLRTEYQWFNNVGETGTTGVADVHYVSMGVSYYFGDATPAVVAAPVVAEVVAEPTPELPAATLSTGAFAHDSATLTPAAKESLDPVATYLNDNQEVSVDVIGYTDSTGAAEYNQQLSEKRAQAASDYLSSEGVDATRISTEGKGEENPIADNSTAEGREQNRRVEVYYKD
ncbi:MAG: OmpA family protein [Vibrio sp.]